MDTELAHFDITYTNRFLPGSYYWSEGIEMSLINQDILNTLENSEIWDSRYDLPLVPQHNNPIYYAALAYVCAGILPNSAWRNLLNFMKDCHQWTPDGGWKYYRWPDKSGGAFSHDEMIGWAYFYPAYAMEFLVRLDESDGLFDRNFEKDTFDRFIFLRPFLLASANYRVGTISQIQYCAHLVWSLLTYKPGNDSGTLKIWIMNEKMKKFPITDLCIQWWSARMKKKGIGPKYILSNVYLTECPTFAKLAPENF